MFSVLILFMIHGYGSKLAIIIDQYRISFLILSAHRKRVRSLELNYQKKGGDSMLHLTRSIAIRIVDEKQHEYGFSPDKEYQVIGTTYRDIEKKGEHGKKFTERVDCLVVVNDDGKIRSPFASSCIVSSIGGEVL